MKKEFKQSLYFSFIYILLYLITTVLLFVLFKEVKTSILISIAAVIAYVLSPRFKEIDTQSGTKYQMKWIFMKKTYMI